MAEIKLTKQFEKQTTILITKTRWSDKSQVRQRVFCALAANFLPTLQFKCPFSKTSSFQSSDVTVGTPKGQGGAVEVASKIDPGGVRIVRSLTGSQDFTLRQF